MPVARPGGQLAFMRGYSLLELTATLALVAIASATLHPFFRGYRDRATVLLAREAIVGLIQDTRTAALEHGGASLHLDANDVSAWITVGDSVTRRDRVGEQGRLRIALGGGRVSTEIPYSGLGIGVFANETVSLLAGSHRAGVVISAYGRVRRD
jgi:prepilin-type N-terminal cleavage/methylation domain-containing protein